MSVQKFSTVESTSRAIDAIGAFRRQYGERPEMACTHRDQVLLTIPPDRDKHGTVCAECVAMGSRWVHLRICLTCGHVGCCDSSPNRHAREHWQNTVHPIVGSMEPRETWSYCFEDDEFL